MKLGCIDEEVTRALMKMECYLGRLKIFVLGKLNKRARERAAMGKGRFPRVARGPHGLERTFGTKLEFRLIACSRFIAQTNVELSLYARKRFK
ncbi:hypothetical protein CRG98_042824 [Punica granatum]|uniref:Uncharacterized protein n=1 Tax=Punica granatum TaxID=22663 RepID=A0A2I0HYL9_PUNGR|nr:hypothetical protein CRG98_042824 [Punica granatum]